MENHFSVRHHPSMYEVFLAKNLISMAILSTHSHYSVTDTHKNHSNVVRDNLTTISTKCLEHLNTL